MHMMGALGQLSCSSLLLTPQAGRKVEVSNVRVYLEDGSFKVGLGFGFRTWATRLVVESFVSLAYVMVPGACRLLRMHIHVCMYLYMYICTHRHMYGHPP